MRILIAEDDMIARRMLQATLAKWEFEVVATADGTEALEALRADDAPRLAILDWMMPGLDGVDVCRRLRESSSANRTYIILLTAKNEKEDIVAGLEVGADDYIAKPFDRKELRARINVGLRIIELQEALGERVRELERLNEKLENLSTRDGLTGVSNRRRFDEILEREWRRAQREEQPLSLVMIDIDSFKKFNDNYGHLGGDDCLKRVATALAEGVRRGGDFLARYGGEEFGVLLGGTGLDGAKHLAETLRKRVEDLRIPHEFSETAPHVTISLGVATMRPARGAKPTDLIEIADKGLYLAKRSGRNRVCVAPQAEAAPDESA